MHGCQLMCDSVHYSSVICETFDGPTLLVSTLMSHNYTEVVGLH